MPLLLPSESRFTSRLRSPAVAARIGLWLGLCFALAFLTGLVSHWAQSPTPWIGFPTAPSWGYRVTQGLHVIVGTACVPLLLVKLWTVYPRLFQPLRAPRSRAGLLHLLERGSIALLVAAAIFQLVSGLTNSAQWYPWSFGFRGAHHAAAWIAIGSLVVHVAVKLPVIRRALTHDVEYDDQDRPGTRQRSAGLSRRGLLRTTWAATAVAVLATAGATVTPLRRLSVLATRDGEGPQGVPVNRTASAAGVTTSAVDPAYRLRIVSGDRSVELSRDELAALPQETRDLPIACVEGWSAQASWGGVAVRDLLDLVGAPRGSDVEVGSLEASGTYAVTRLPADFADDRDTLLALRIGEEDLDLDHGFPCRLIAPNRPGVLQTKWVARLEVLA